MENTKELTLGEKRVGLNFNPSNDPIVTQIKTQVAALIDLCESLKAKEPRLAATAQTQFEGASMWAVKLATTKSVEDKKPEDGAGQTTAPAGGEAGATSAGGTTTDGAGVAPGGAAA